MEHATPGVTKIHAQLLQIRVDIDAKQDQLDDITLSENDSTVLNEHLAEKEQGTLLSDKQVSVALGGEASLNR